MNSKLFNGKKNITGERIHLAREKKGISQKDLAAKLQTVGVVIDHNGVSRIESVNKKAMKNRHFKKAASLQEILYERIRGGDFSTFSDIPKILGLYQKSYLDGRSSAESAVNHTALFCLYTVTAIHSSHILHDRPASFSDMYEKMDEDNVKQIPGSLISEMEAVATFLESSYELFFEEEKRRLFDYLGVMAGSPGYVHLGLFYLASSYLYNILGHGSTPEHNRKDGLDLMYSLYFMKNTYAAGFFNRAPF